MGTVETVCADVLKWAETYTDEPFHAMLCDPPYHLTDVARTLQMKGESIDPRSRRVRSNNRRKSTGFMGKVWDGGNIAFRPETWAALAEHLLPGAWLMAFASSRGWHRLAVAVEDSGMIIQPSIFGWCNSQAFPKAANISKGIDKAAGAKREVIGLHSNPAKNDGSGVAMRAIPSGRTGKCNITAPATPLARAWEGHRYGGQVLKDSLNPIICAQKPWVGKRLDCIVETGAGSLWVDGGRVVAENHLTAQRPCGKISTLWENEEDHSSLSVRDAASQKKPITLETKASSVQRNVAQTLNEKGAMIPSAINRGDIGCFSGPSLEAQGASQRENINLSTDGSGKIIADQSQKGTLSTMPTVTNLTTGLKTLSLCEEVSMPTSISGKAAQKNPDDVTETSLDSKKDAQSMSVSAGPKSGRWPSNFYLQHSPLCQARGTRRVKGSNIKGSNDGSKASLFGNVYDANSPEYTDASGHEMVQRFACEIRCQACDHVWIAEDKEPCAECGGAGEWACAVRKLGEQSGDTSRSQVRHEAYDKPLLSGETDFKRGMDKTILNDYGDRGTAARFFPNPDWSLEVAETLAGADPVRYCAKSSRAERDAGLDDMEPIEALYRGNLVCKACGHQKQSGSPCQCEEPDWDYKPLKPQRCTHPTVKPLSLNKWLATLLLPPLEYAPRRLLVPFGGVCSEAIGALLAGWEHITVIEMSKEYCDIGKARVKFWQGWSERTGETEPKAILKAHKKAVKTAAKAKPPAPQQVALQL